MPTDDGLDATATSGATPRATRAPGDFRPGDQLGRYVIERVLGAGGMGLVYAAHDPDLDRRVAIKILRNDAGEEARVRLLREARAMAKLSHPNVITVYEVGSSAGVDFVAMELLEGGTLGEWLRAERRPPLEVLRRFRAAGAGLAAAHARGLVHRDFKPANVLLGRDGRVVVTDFGLARGFEHDALAETAPSPDVETPPPPPSPTVALDDTLAATSRASLSRSGDLSSTLTRTGAMVGTPAYMAPEQFGGAAVGPAADQFAFAVALWEGLTGQRPFRGDTVEELRRAADREPPQGADLPRGVRPILVRALARDPAARWPDVAALLDALEHRLRPRQLRVGVAAALAIGAIAGGVYLNQRGGDRPAATAPTCALTDDAIATIWTPTSIADLDRRFAAAPAWAELRAGLDRFVADWRTERAAACAAPDAANHHGRIACLTGLRDELGAALALLPEVPADALPRSGLGDVLPPPAACQSGRRAAMPRLPDDPAIRAELSQLVSAAATAKLVARGRDADAAKAKAEQVVAAARRLAPRYPPALAIGLETQATIAHVADDCATAMPLYEEAATAAEAASADGLRAMARIGVLECAIATSSNLAQIERYGEQARAAIQRAGDDRQLGAALEMTLAGLDATVGKSDQAIPRLAKARAAFLEHGDLRRASTAALLEAELRMLRDDWDERPEIIRLYREGLALRERVYGPGHPDTERTRLGVALLIDDRDPVEAGRMIAEANSRLPIKPAPDDAVMLRGRVVDDRGRPVAGAQVLAATQLWARHDGVPTVFDGSFRGQTTTDADGRYVVQAPPDALVVAWGDRGVARAVPARAARELRIDPPAALELTLTVTRADPAPAPAAPPSARSAVVAIAVLDSFGFRVSTVSARRLDHDRWAVTRTYPGKLHLLAIAVSPLGDNLLVVWPTAVAPGATAGLQHSIDLRGALVDVIVRAERGAIPTAQVMLLPGRLARPPRTVGELSEHWRAPRRHFANVGPVTEANQTDAGAALYRPGDIHARLTAVLPGAYTACVIPFAGDIRDPSYTRTLLDQQDLEVTCAPIAIGERANQAIVLEASPMKNQPAR
jgi:predicted Ser/Thr protein kinase